MKRFFKITLTVVAVLAAIVCAAVLVWHGEIATMRTIKSVDGNRYLYSMEYKAGYDLDDVINSDLDSNAKLLN